MATLRRYLSGQYDWTGLSARILRSARFELAALGVVALAVLALIIIYHLAIVKLDLGTFRSTALGMEHMFPRIRYFTAAVFLIPACFMLSNVSRMHRLTMRDLAIPLRFYVAEATALVVNTVAHSEILKCAARDRRMKWTMHWIMAAGCVLLVIVKLFFLRWFQTDRILPLYHPQRWLGYLAAAGILLGAGEILTAWFRQRKPQHWSSRRSDLTLPALLAATAASGIAVHVCRYAGLEMAAHYLYALHLMIAVPMLVVEVPFGHWAHMIYRPLALYFAAVQMRAAADQPRKAVAA